MKLFIINIDSVDGSFYCYGAWHKNRLMDFLSRYDHEGSSLSINVRENKKEIEHIEGNEEVYRYLKS